MYETLEIEVEPRGVAWLWLNRADKHNAMSGLMIAELSQAAAALAVNPQVRAVVLGGRGASFCAGGDLGWMRAQMGADAETRAQGATGLARMLQSLNTLPKPLIGRVHGNAFGGGVGLVSVCDVAIGTQAILMGLTETRLGLIPATIGPYVCARMGEARARRVFMSGRRFGADEAVGLGLLAKSVASALPDTVPDIASGTGSGTVGQTRLESALDLAVEAEISPYLSCAPAAVARAKALLRHLGPVIDEATIQHSIAELSACWAGTEAPEGIAAFFDKRKPDWAALD